MDRYNHLREAELEMAYLETMRDYENGDYKIVSAKYHSVSIDMNYRIIIDFIIIDKQIFLIDIGSHSEVY
jgi:mRNA-degrading endonuclease YafQ of YafQ-DinJ toxin-antitoxin module